MVQIPLNTFRLDAILLEMGENFPCQRRRGSMRVFVSVHMRICVAVIEAEIVPDLGWFFHVDCAHLKKMLASNQGSLSLSLFCCFSRVPTLDRLILVALEMPTRDDDRFWV